MICSGEEYGKTFFSWYLEKYNSSDSFRSGDISIERVSDVIHSDGSTDSNGLQYLRGDFLVSLGYLTRL